MQFTPLKKFLHIVVIQILSAILFQSLAFAFPDKYSINLMWINAPENSKKQYITNADNETELKNKHLAPAMKWAITNPTAQVFFWYDSVHTTPAAIATTQHVLDELKEQRRCCANLFLRDVREIPIVRDNPDAFSTSTPLYFRVDLLKLIIIVNAIERERMEAAIFADLEVGDLRPAGMSPRPDKEELFNDFVMSALDKYGLIINKDSRANRNENQFLQLVDNPPMLFSIKTVIINVALTRVEFELNNDQALLRYLTDSAYISTRENVFNFYNAIKLQQPIKVRPDIPELPGIIDTESAEHKLWVDYVDDVRMRPPASWKDYDLAKYGYLPFGNAVDASRMPVLMTEKNELYAVSKDVMKYPGFVGITGAPARRDLFTRSGNSHGPGRILIIPPASGGKYKVKVWE